ncbi:hypothetical protein KC19_4G020200 [Ceratodon purpureus]|uniref:Uncharacterized protein n=1 Tax=Ceratodon purpureus TaxID=3225 RepID=A0A8T0I4H1_CERPU|nr:hypothetical protein KC19_4G020200 [Ceratodon purpureus]
MQELIAMIKRSASESRHPRGHTADAIETHQSSPHKPESPTASMKTVLLSPASAVTETINKAKENVETRVSSGNSRSPNSNETTFEANTPRLPMPSDETAKANGDAVVAAVTLPVDDLSTAAPSDNDPPIDVAACGYHTRPDPILTPMETPREMMDILLPQASDWDNDFEPLPPRRIQQTTVVPVETRGRKKGKTTSMCTKVPPEPILPRDEGCDPISVGKPVWILHEQFPLIVVAQGKAGVAWRTKSNKLGAQCSEGHQWIHVHRIFKHSVPLLFPEPKVGCSVLESALPPAQGRHKQIMWSSRHLITYKP